MFFYARKESRGKQLDVETRKVIVCKNLMLYLINIVGNHCL